MFNNDGKRKCMPRMHCWTWDDLLVEMVNQCIANSDAVNQFCSNKTWAVTEHGEKTEVTNDFISVWFENRNGTLTAYAIYNAWACAGIEESDMQTAFPCDMDWQAFYNRLVYA